MSTDPALPRGGAWWHCAIAAEGGRPARLVAVESDRYPDGTRVELTAAAAAIQVGDSAVCSVDFDDGAVTRIEVAERVAPKAPPLWFVELREPSARPPAVALVAFTGADVRAGALLDESAVSNVAVSGEDQVAALRWYPATGQVDQVYVQPQWRRRHVAATLLMASALLAVARDWPRLWGSGVRTELGEQLRNGRSWRARFDELTAIAPPMTPGEPDMRETGPPPTSR